MNRIMIPKHLRGEAPSGRDYYGDGDGHGDGDGKMSHTWLTHSPEQGEMVSHGPEFLHLMVFFGYG